MSDPTRRQGTPPTSVTAVIVAYESSEVLPDCLASLPAAFDGIDQWDVVVVDNASTDGSATSARRLSPQAQVIELSCNGGYAAGLNVGIAAATGSAAVLVLNPDVRLRPGAVMHLAAALRTRHDGIAVPRLTDADGRLQASLRRRPTVLRAFGEALLGGDRAGRFSVAGEVVSAPADYLRPCVADWATGAVMLISRPCLDAMAASRHDGKPWDESFFLYSEETEFCLTGKDLGFNLQYVPAAEATHLGGESGTSPALWALLTRNRVALFRRRNGALRSAAFWCAVVLNEALRSTRGATHRAALRALLSRTHPERRTSDETPAVPGYICFSAQDWWYHNQSHSDFQLMRRIARSRKVLVVNSISMRMPLPGRSTMFLRRILRKARSMARVLQRPLPGLPDFWVFTPVIVPFYGSRAGRTVNAALVRWQVTLAARRVGIRDPVLVLTIPTAWEVTRPMPRRKMLFNRSDKHSTFAESDRSSIESMEEALLRHADTVLYVSRALMADEAALTGSRAVFLDHGVDLEHFTRRAPEEEPSDLCGIAHPRIGFFGGFDDYIIDFDLLERLARELPEAHLVLIGDATCSMKRFEELPNVHWLGYRSYEEIPSYGSGFDVALMPWLDNEWIRHSNPIKMKEYLALGLPVVSTDFPEVRRYRSVIHIAQSDDDFVALVRQLVVAPEGDSTSPEDRRRAVADASWDSRAARVIEYAEGGCGG